MVARAVFSNFFSKIIFHISGTSVYENVYRPAEADSGEFAVATGEASLQQYKTNTDNTTDCNIKYEVTD